MVKLKIVVDEVLVRRLEETYKIFGIQPPVGKKEWNLAINQLLKDTIEDYRKAKEIQDRPVDNSYIGWLQCGK
jgi:hypothetical protein